MKKLIILIAAFFVAFFAHSQTAKRYYEQGLSKAEKGDYQRAIADYTKAIELDPDYVDAYAGLAYSFYLLPLINEITPHESVQKVNDITSEILAIDPDNFIAHNVLFMVYYYYSHDWDKAEAEYKKAVEITQRPSMQIGYNT